VRPLLVEHCYECHSEEAGEQQGGLLLDRQTGWMEGGDTNKAVIPGEPDASLLITAVRYDDDDLQMPPDGRLSDEEIKLLEDWVARGAGGPAEDMGETDFSRLGDQAYLFEQAKDHWAFQPVRKVRPPSPNIPTSHASWNKQPVDRFVFDAQAAAGIKPSRQADARTLVRRLYHDLTGLPPTFEQIESFVDVADRDLDQAITELTQRLMDSPEYGQHMARLWLDVARYADTDNNYRADTKTPYYYPFAFTYRDYVVDAFNADKPLDQFIKEQIAADQLGFKKEDPETAALGFLAAGPYGTRSPTEAYDDWIDLTSRGLLGLTVACARCHDHKFEPIPTADYYSLRGVFAALSRPNPLDEKRQPEMPGYEPTASQLADYQEKRAEIDAKIKAAAGKTSRNNRRPLSTRIKDTELATLLTFHPGAPARAMVISDVKNAPAAFVFIRGDSRSRGVKVERNFLKILDPEQPVFETGSSGRLDLAEKIASKDNPLTARVFVNRIWGQLIGSHLVNTPSDFGLQGAPPTHPDLLDWLADDFVQHGWSVKHLVKQIVTTQTYQQSGRILEVSESIDPENKLLWRANRKHMTIEAIRDRMLAASDQLDRRTRGRAEPLWGEDYTRRRAIYGFINRFNLDPTLRAFDFPAPIQTEPKRGESIVAPQALFLMNSPMVADQAKSLAESEGFESLDTDEERIAYLFRKVLGRDPVSNEMIRSLKLVEYQARFKQPASGNGRWILTPWPLIAQALMMSNEFQYVD
jgi:hypothetical protein